MTLTLEKADQIVDAALAEARKANSKPMAFIVLDARGVPVVYKQEDKSSLFRFDIARAKAMGALGMGMDTRALSEKAKNNPVFFTSVAVATGGDVAFSPGGVLILDSDKNIIGAVGASGDTPDIDEACSKRAIEAAGFGLKG